MPKKLFLVVLMVVMGGFAFSQEKEVDSTYIKEILAFQKNLDEQYRDEARSPLHKKDRKNFTGHSFYKINPAYRVTATLKRTPTARPFMMKSTSNRQHEYVKYGVLTFKLNGVSLRLSVYQSVSHQKSEQYKNFLFLPFKDRTNGKGTYSGGRYLDLEIPEGDTLIIDFNKAYNPYFPYNREYSSHLVPRENHLLVEVKAGMKSYEGKLTGH